jgi:hypothetical protein
MLGRGLLLQKKVAENTETQPPAKRLIWEQCSSGKHFTDIYQFLLSFCVIWLYKSILPVALVTITLV